MKMLLIVFVTGMLLVASPEELGPVGKQAVTTGFPALLRIDPYQMASISAPPLVPFADDRWQIGLPDQSIVVRHGIPLPGQTSVAAAKAPFERLPQQRPVMDERPDHRAVLVPKTQFVDESDPRRMVGVIPRIDRIVRNQHLAA